MHYYLYEVRNNLNGKIYVGVHKTKSLDDGYMGSGKVIKRAIEKHGIENFTKVILETFESSVDMYAREKEVVNEVFLAREDVYNLRRGGHGGFDHINKTGLNLQGVSNRTDESIQKIKAGGHKGGVILSLRCGGFKNQRVQVKSREVKALVGYNSWLIGSRRSVETKEKMSSSQSGGANSQFGTKWITDGVNSCKIKSHEQIPTGWRRGRTLSGGQDECNCAGEA